MTKPKWIPKVGDRIRVYGFDSEDASKVLTRTICEIDSDGMIETECCEIVHPRQCRLLVKKPRRRVWVFQPRNDSYRYPIAYPSIAAVADANGRDVIHEAIEFVEVRRK